MNKFWLKQIYEEAVKRYLDGEFLSSKRSSDSGYLLKLLGFELLLKAALYIDKGKEDYSHNYYAVYCTLSRDVKKNLVSEAQQISQIFDIKDKIKNILTWYSDNFVRLRYPFNSYKCLTEPEYKEYSKLYSELGCPEGEAEFEYYPEELRGLFMALEVYVKKNC
ncbi:MAG: hypothetical protein VST71_10030 [Nitrospirota bacterium]|nr:hypothetical protein [Nitrospirota bacterium]